ncbi:DUF4270 family protein [Paraflavitalea pollutisoli]|uniref:DUF4270 family protein n=1 Tax=Paraflavitalea pollutisoli TaxID=3034143 RepID=UPI0023EDB9C3|nr:DUF4270 family protein [Paraflavitalea sp. H1-2-19X]
MTLPRSATRVLPVVIFLALFFTSCYKDEISFGDITDGDSNTRIITIDTITPVMSTVVLDSFPTNGNKIILIGRWSDAQLGTTDASTYLQFGLPADLVSFTFPNDAVYDSIALGFNPIQQYYGDTLGAQTYSVYEMAYQPDYTYASQIYNTSTTGLLPAPLASVTRQLRPGYGDSLQIRLPQDKGLDLYNKIRTNATEVSTADNFLNYLRGFCIRVGATDKGAIYSFNADSSVVMKLHYHTTIPTYQEHIIQFYITRTDYQYNRVVSDRSNTPLAPKNNLQTEFFPDAQTSYAFSQAGTGVMMKVKFPSLRNILGYTPVVRLISAKLVLKPVEQTFDDYGYRLPDSLYLAQTDASNLIGSALTSSDGASMMYASPFVDYISRSNTNYTFDVSSYINYLLTTAGTTEGGFFVLQEAPGTTQGLDRVLMGSANHPKYKTQLSVTVMAVE